MPVEKKLKKCLSCSLKAKDELIVDFGDTIGIWVWYNDSSWGKLHNLSPEIIALGDMDGNGQNDVIINFGPGIGIRVFYNDTIWTKLHPTTCELMTTGNMDGN